MATTYSACRWIAVLGTRITLPALASWAALISPAAADAWSECQNPAVDRMLVGCSQVITERRESPANLTIAYLRRGLVLTSQGRFEQAIADLDEVMRLDPSMAAVYQVRGAAYGSLRKFELAIADFTEAIGRNPNDAESYGNRGGAYLQMGRHDLAMTDLNKAITLNPN